MSTHLREEDYIPYIDGRLATDEGAQVDEHLAKCGACRTRVEELRSLMGVLDKWTGVQASPGFDAGLRAQLEQEKTRTTGWGWLVFPPAYAVALVAIVVALAIIFWPSGAPGPVQPEVVQTPPQQATPEVAQATLGADALELALAGDSEDLAALENPVLLENYELLEQFDILFEPLNGDEKL